MATWGAILIDTTANTGLISSSAATTPSLPTRISLTQYNIFPTVTSTANYTYGDTYNGSVAIAGTVLNRPIPTQTRTILNLLAGPPSTSLGSYKRVLIVYDLTTAGVYQIFPNNKYQLTWYNGMNPDNYTTQTTYFMRGWDTGSNAFVYWSSRGSANISPITTTPVLTGVLQNVTVLATM